MFPADLPYLPIAWPDLIQWRKQTRSVVLTFAGLPLLVSICLWAAYLQSGARPSDVELAGLLQSNLWGIQIILSAWLGMVVTLRCAAGIARLREASNWPLVKVMPYATEEIYRQKSRAVEVSVRWPVRLVLLLRVACVLLTVGTYGNGGLLEAPLGSLFLFMFCNDLLVSVRYNCAVGLLASTWARTTAQAQAVSLLLQLGLSGLVFAPIWWQFARGGPPFGNGSLVAGGGELILSCIVLFGVLAVVQWAFISIAYGWCVHHAERMSE
jgi:hypothetical protein